MIGEFEYLVLSSAARLGEEAYGMSILVEIEQLTRRRCSAGALYRTIERLERKGLLKSWMGEATPQRGGRAKRMVRLTTAGRRAGGEFFRTFINASRRLAWDAQ